MAHSNRHYIISFALVLALFLSPCVKSESCMITEFKNWLNKPFTMSGTEEDLFIYTKCNLPSSMFSGAIESLDWDWSNPHCNDKKTIGYEKTDDFKCSFSDGTHEGIFDHSCRIHDMCLKTNGQTKDSCDDSFGDNMRHQCEWHYKDDITTITLAGCLGIASAWEAGVSNPCESWLNAIEGSCHRGGIDATKCMNCDWACYLDRYPDLKNAYGDNLEAAQNHYYVFGFNENRNCKCDAYTKYPEYGCSGQNELGDEYDKSEIECTAICKKDDRCRSFEYWPKHPTYNKRTCSMSSSCIFNNGAKFLDNKGISLYIKSKYDVFTLYEDYGCSQQNDDESALDLGQCRSKCINNPQCVSFEWYPYRPGHSNWCSLSYSCTYSAASIYKGDDFKLYLYTKTGAGTPAKNDHFNVDQIVNIKPSAPSSSIWKIIVSSPWLWMIGALLIIILLFNICLMHIGFYANRCNLGRKNNQYSSVKPFEFDNTDNNQIKI